MKRNGMGAELPYMPWFPGDFIQSPRVQVLTDMEELIYRRLLDAQWLNEGRGLPADDARLAKLARVSDAVWAAAAAAVRPFFEPNNEGALFNRRCASEWNRSLEFRAEQSRKGKLSAERRWGNRGYNRPNASVVTDPVTEVVTESNHPSPSPSPDEESDEYGCSELAGGPAPPSLSHDQVKQEEDTPLPPDPPIPPELANLALYRVDKKLCARWPELIAAWTEAYPNLNVPKTVASAHAWEVANVKRRKRDKARFLQSWLDKEQDRSSTTWPTYNKRSETKYNPEARATELENYVPE